MILNLTELSAEPIHSQLARQIRAGILAGSLAEGEAIPLRAFARRHRVSSSSVERAFGALAEEGLMAAERDGRYAVAALDEARRRELERERQLETLLEREVAAKELELAREIQCRLLPPRRIDGDGWTVVARNEPARFVTGDFYDVVRHGDGSVDLVVADVAGKGLGPGLIMASVKAALPFLASGRAVPDVLAELNRKLCAELGRREFVALAIARFTPASGRLELANAGLPDPYLLRARTSRRRPSLRAVEVPGERLPLGLRSRVEHTSTTLTLDPGDRLLLLTDGPPEAETDAGEPLGYDRLATRIAAARGDDPETWLDALLEDLRFATAAARRDDWTAMVLERRRR